MKILFIILSSLFWLGCSSRNTEITKVMNENIENMSIYIQALEKAETPEQFAEAIHAYAGKTREFGPKFKALKAKYPELRNTKKIPKGLEAVTFASEQTMKNLVTASARVEKYEDHPAVKEAMKDLIQAWIDTQ